MLLLGAGGLGSPAALYLAAAGVGTLGIVDNDEVDLSNLQRQVIHSTDRIGVPKVDSAEQTINALNPDVKVEKHAVRLGAENIMEILPGYDIVVDGLDNFPTRYLLNDASVRLQIPVVSAAILGFEGQLSVFKPYDGPCYRCLFPVPPPAELAPSCGANGVLGVLPGTMGLLQATEVIKLILGEGEPLIGRLLMYDALAATDHRGQGPPRPRRARSARAIPTRSPTRRWACSPTTKRSARAPTRVQRRWQPFASRPCCGPSVGGEKELTADGSSVGEILRVGRREPSRDRSRSCSPPTAGSTATSTSTSTTRTSACSTASTRPSATTDTLVILPAMAGGLALDARRSERHRTLIPGRVGALGRL